MTDQLSYYIKKLTQLKVDRSKGEPAPHKPILLLSILQEVEAGNISSNRIAITGELVARFKDNFNKLVEPEKFVANFALPFYHLKTSGFWYLQLKMGMQLTLTSSFSIKSLNQLIRVIDYACFDKELFQLIADRNTRTVLLRALIETYFQGSAGKIVKDNNYFQQIESLLLNEPAAEYRKEVLHLDEEEIFIRKGAFKKVVPKIYNQTCCISGLRIISLADFQMIDACHIISFAESHDDTITNGLSLCPNLHRAFDRHLISIDENYRVQISNNFSESAVPYSLKQFEGKQILLPNEEKYYPGLENLRKHRDRFKSLTQ